MKISSKTFGVSIGKIKISFRQVNIIYHTGLASVSFRDLSPEQIIEAVKKAGLRWIEWGSDVHAPCYDYENLNFILRASNHNSMLNKETGVVSLKKLCDGLEISIRM